MFTFVLGADHAGFRLKEALKGFLRQRGVSVHDLSETYVEGDDYPSIAHHVAQHVANHAETFGLLVCGSGFGMDIAANRHKGIRAAVIRTAEEAQTCREHNHANILVLGERFTSEKQAKHLLETWLETRPSYAQRHVRRIHLIDTPHG